MWRITISYGAGIGLSPKPALSTSNKICFGSIAEMAASTSSISKIHGLLDRAKKGSHPCKWFLSSYIRSNYVKIAVLIFLMGAAIGAGQHAPSTGVQPAAEPVQRMTNATVVQMVQAKISPDLIIMAISKCEPHFQLDPSNAQYMLQKGVTEDIYSAMAARQMRQPVPESTQLVP